MRPDTAKGLLPTALVAVLVVASVIAAAAAGPWTIGRRDVGAPQIMLTPPQPSRSPLPESLPDGLVPGQALPSWLGWLGAAFAVLCVAVLVYLLVVAVRALLRSWAARDQTARDEAPDDLVVDADDEALTPVLRAGVARAAQALAGGADPGDAVVAAWVALEEAAERSGVERDPAHTASELTVAVLDATRADPEATRTLLGLYLTARFSTRPVTDDDVRRAQECLEALADGLGARRDADPGAGPDSAGPDSAGPDPGAHARTGSPGAPPPPAAPLAGS